MTWSKNVTDKPLSKDKSDRVTSNLELENNTSNKWPNFSKMDKMKSSYLTSDVSIELKPPIHTNYIVNIPDRQPSNSTQNPYQR